MSDKVFVFDTTLRDGEQVPGCQLNTIEKIEIAKALEELGVDIIEAGFPISSPGDFTSVVEISKAVTKPVVCALTRAVQKDIDVAVESLAFAKRKRIHTGIGASEEHIKYKFNSTREDIIERAVYAVSYAKKFVEDIQFYAEDAGRADNEFLARLVKAVIKAGATVVNIPDTTGFRLPWEFGEKIAYLKANVSNIDKAVIAVHCHNDLGMATANTLEGVVNGARQVEVTMNGIGERAGNTSLEEVVMIFNTHKSLNLHTEVVTKKIMKTSRMVSRLMRMPIQPNKAIVGKNAFAHSSGIHQDGVLKNRENYEIIDPKDIGIDTDIVLSARSGRAALNHHLKRLGYESDKKQLDAVYAEFLTLADRKKDIHDDDLHVLMGKERGDKAIKLELLEVLCGEPLQPMATVRINFKGVVHTSASTGNGPVDASFKAIDFIVNMPVVLEEYLVQAITEGSDDHGKVHIQLTHNSKLYYGFGSHTDIVVASVLAYIDALNKIV